MDKDFDQWNQIKKRLHEKVESKFFHEREIWWSSLGVNVGDEEDGKNNLFERPVLIIKKFNRSLILTVPLTTKIKTGPYYFLFDHQGNKYAVILSQLRLISTKRLLRRIRRMPRSYFASVIEAIRKRCLPL